MARKTMEISLNLEDILVGAKGITYLMFLCRKVNQADVGKVLCKNKIVKNQNVVRVHVNKLAKKKLLTKGKRLHLPGPPKIRRVRTLQPIFHTVSFYRVWKMFPEDRRRLAHEEKVKMTMLFKRIAPLLDYFPRYLHLWCAQNKKKVRTLTWQQTLSVFYQFCLWIVEACWDACEHNLDFKVLPTLKPQEKLLDLGSAPYRYVYEAHQTGKITIETISTLANFSVNGRKDIYTDTFLRELYLTSISLRNPLEAYAHFNYTEDVAKATIEGRLENIRLLALRNAIFDKATREQRQLESHLKEIADHKVRDETLQKFLGYEEKDVEKVLEGLIEKFNLDISKKELMRALVNLELCRLLRSHIEQLKPTLYLKKKGESD